ncbi:MAG: FeS-binding protein [Desulfobacterales bacterium]
MATDALRPAIRIRPGGPARFVFRGLVFVLALTGFGQLPIYNRYYLSDLPGFGWLADYWATRFVHYAAAALFLGLLAHRTARHLFSPRARRRLTRSGALRAGILTVLVLSGGLIVVKNFPGVFLSDAAVIAVDLVHLGAATAFLLAQLAAMLARRPWTEPLAREPIPPFNPRPETPRGT